MVMQGSWNIKTLLKSSTFTIAHVIARYLESKHIMHVLLITNDPSDIDDYSEAQKKVSSYIINILQVL